LLKHIRLKTNDKSQPAVMNSNSLKKIYEKILLYIQKTNRYCETYPLRALVVLYVFFASIKIIVTQLFIDPSNLVDGFIYMKMARSFFQTATFQIYRQPTHQYPPLYPILISPSYVFTDTLSIMKMIRILSVFYSSLIIFPAYFIAKECIDTKKSLLAASIVSIQAGVFVWVFNSVSEIIFYSLFLAAVYFIYKSGFEQGYKYKLLTGIFIGLCFLSRYTAVIFAPAIFLFYIVTIKNTQKKSWINATILSVKHCLIISIPAGLTVLPWLIRNGNLFGYSLTGILGYAKHISQAAERIIAMSDAMSFSQPSTTAATTTNYILNFIIHAFVDYGIITLSCAILFFVLSIWLLLYTYKQKKTYLFCLCVLCFLVTFFLIIVDSIHNITVPFRLHARYLEPVFALFTILGIVALTKIDRLHQKIIYLLLLLCLPFSLLLSNTWGHMGGMISVSYIGVLKNINLYLSKFFTISIKSPVHIPNTILISFIIFCLFLMFFIVIKYNISKKKIAAIACLLLLSSTTISTAGYITRDAYTTQSDLYEFGVWLNQQFSGKNEIIFIDENLSIALNQLSVWINAPIVVDSFNQTKNNNTSMYLITNNQYNYSLLHSKHITAPLGGFIRGRNPWSTMVYVYQIIE
jgi:4-amino-4-deoxy-L-arabinose transferase-like glycosyltransferase